MPIIARGEGAPGIELLCTPMPWAFRHLETVGPRAGCRPNETKPNPPPPRAKPQSPAQSFRLAPVQAAAGTSPSGAQARGTSRTSLGSARAAGAQRSGPCAAAAARRGSGTGRCGGSAGARGRRGSGGTPCTPARANGGFAGAGAGLLLSRGGGGGGEGVLDPKLGVPKMA